MNRFSVYLETSCSYIKATLKIILPFHYLLLSEVWYGPMKNAAFEMSCLHPRFNQINLDICSDQALQTMEKHRKPKPREIRTDFPGVQTKITPAMHELNFYRVLVDHRVKIDEIIQAYSKTIRCVERFSGCYRCLYGCFRTLT